MPVTSVPVINLEMIRGDTRFWDGQLSRYGVPENPTGGKIYFTVKAAYADLDASAKIAKTSASAAITITDATSGSFRIKLAPSDTSSLAAEVLNYVYDIQYKTSTGDIWTVARGSFTIYPDVTQTIA